MCLLALSVTLVLAVIIDLDRPRSGFIDGSQQAFALNASKGAFALEPRLNVFNEVVFVDDLNLPQWLRAQPQHASSG